jgi:hypothetical protein
LDETNEDILPPGAKWDTGWGTVEHSAELFGKLELSATSPFMAGVRATETALAPHPQSPHATTPRPVSSNGEQPRRSSRSNSPFTFRLPELQSPNNLPSSHVRLPTSDRLNFGPPIYLSKRLKQHEQERSMRQQQLLQQYQQQNGQYYADSDINSLGSLSRSVVEGDGSYVGGSYKMGGGNTITVPPRVADVLPYQPEAAKSQMMAVGHRRTPKKLGMSQSSPNLSPSGTAYRPIDRLGALPSSRQFKHNQDTVLSLSSDGLFS